MPYATLMVWVNVDHVSKQLASVAASLADKFASKLGDRFVAGIWIRRSGWRN